MRKKFLALRANNAHRANAMSYLSERLRASMEQHSCTQGSLAERSGVPIAVINRALNDQTEIGDANYERIVCALTHDPIEQSELLAARLRDWCVGPGSDRVVITIDTPILRDTPVLPALLTRSLEFLRVSAHRNRDVRELIIDLAKCLGLEADGAAGQILAESVQQTGGYGRAKRESRRRQPRSAKGSESSGAEGGAGRD